MCKSNQTFMVSCVQCKSIILLCHFCYRFLGKGLVTIPDYETWKPRRQLYDPSFRKRCKLTCTKQEFSPSRNSGIMSGRGFGDICDHINRFPSYIIMKPTVNVCMESIYYPLIGATTPKVSGGNTAKLHECGQFLSPLFQHWKRYSYQNVDFQ